MSDYDSYERQADVLKLIWDSVLKTLQLITPTLSEAKNVEELHFGEKHARREAQSRQTNVKVKFFEPKRRAPAPKSPRTTRQDTTNKRGGTHYTQTAQAFTTIGLIC